MGIQHALAEQASQGQLRQGNEPNQPVQPEVAGGQGQESGGSAPGSIQPRSYYTEFSAQTRVGVYKPPGPINSNNPCDLQTRFNGSKTAYARYIEYAKKAVIIDRGFDINLLRHALIRKMIRDQGWTEFCTHHNEVSNWELCREFYANMDIPRQRTWVRGVSINFGSERLNELLGTSNEDAADYLTYEIINRNTTPTVGGQLMVSRVAHSMCGGPPHQIGNTIAFNQAEVRLELKPSVDLYFSKIKPVSHMHRVSGVTLYGLSEILQGRRINMGRLIFRILTRTTRGVLVYPNMIRRLCVAAGVNFSQFPQERNIEIGGPIPLIEWDDDAEFVYELIQMDRPPTPQARVLEGEQSRMPTPMSRPRARILRPTRGRKRARGNVEVSVNQGDMPETSAAQEQHLPQDDQSQMPSVAPSQNTQFTEISQTLIEMQNKQFELQAKQGEQLKDVIREINEGRMREREAELQNQRRIEERRIELEERRMELEERKMKLEAEREMRNQEFQLKMTQIMASLMPESSQPPQPPPGPPSDQNQPPPGS